MSISNKIKSLVQSQGKTNTELSKYLGMGSVQALTNKFNRGSFSTEDLTKVVSFLGGELIIRVNDVELKLTENDVREIKLTEKHIEKVDNEIKPITKSQSAPIVAPKLDLDKLLAEEPTPKPKSGIISLTKGDSK